MISPNSNSNFWNFGEGKEDSIHRIHNYPAKFPAFITTKALQHAAESGVEVKTVADVFCGCGTTAVESKRNGKNYWGCDINPVATLIARVKVKQYKATTLDRYYSAVAERFGSLATDAQDIEHIASRIRYWFDDKSIDDLLKLKKAIALEIPGQSLYMKFFLCAFSNILKPTSRWLTKSIKPQVDPNKSPIDVLDTFEKQVDRMRKANAENSFPRNNNSMVRIDNRNFLSTRRKRRHSADLVVTSPPYVSSYDYADIHQLSILWLDLATDYRAVRTNMIGNQYGVNPMTKSEISRLCGTGRTVYNNLRQADRRKAETVARYFIDMEKTAVKCWHLLNRNGMAIFVIGNTQYKGVTVDNSEYLVECMERADFHDIEIIERKISSKTMTPYRDSTGRFTRDSTKRKVYSKEFVVIGRKQ